MFDISSFWNKNKIVQSDEKILEEVRKGNSKMFEIIYDKWNKKIFSYLMTILNYNKEEANQILWDVFIVLYEYNKTNKIDNCKSFLYTMSHNKAVDHIKKISEEYNHDFIQDIRIDEQDVEMKEKLNLNFQQDLMNKYLDMLQLTERQVLHLYFYEEKSYEEIAVITWSNKNTVWRNISQAKKKLKEFVEREGVSELLR